MLKRDISSTNILIAAAGGMVGSGWLFSPFISAQIAGSNALIAWIIAIIFMLFIALPLCELGAMYPISGGMANYPTFTHGKEVGFLFAWTTWISYVVMTPIEIQSILQYGSHFFPALVKGQGIFELSGIGYCVAFFIMIFVVFLNTFGIKVLAECNKYASIIKFIIPTIAIFSLLHVSNSWQNVQISLNHKQDWEQIFSALATGGIIFAFTGFQNGLMLAGEVKNPQRNIPLAILGALAIGLILYFMLQLSFIVAMPQKFLGNGWSALNFPGSNSPLVGLSLLVGLAVVAKLLLIDSSFSPFGTTLVYTAATSRILYGMALQEHLPKIFLKTNRYKIPYVTMYVNLAVGFIAFMPFPSWQKMVAFLSSASILSYGIGPICLLALRRLQPDVKRPFKLSNSLIICHLGFYICNLMLYWCGFPIVWKLYVALAIGLFIYFIYKRQNAADDYQSLFWFFSYMTAILIFSAIGNFGGLKLISFPLDLVLLLPISIAFLQFSQCCLIKKVNTPVIFQEVLE